MFRPSILISRTTLSLFAVGTLIYLPTSAHADTPHVTQTITAKLTSEDTTGPITLDALSKNDDARYFSCGQVGIGTVSPFPINLRVGGMLSPVSKLALGADVTITGLHLIPSVSTRIDGDVIFGSNLGGSQTLIPVTLDELYSRSLPGGTKIYFGPGAGVFFGGKTRIGGKVVLGASVNRIGIEAGLDFPGIGNPLFLLQARLGL